MSTSFNLNDLADLANQHRADTLREAEQRRIHTMVAVPVRRSVLARLGKLLSQAGDSLQERYGEPADNLA